MANILSYLFSLFYCVAFSILLDKASSDCPLGWYHYGKLCYFFSHESFDWFVSQSSCHEHNARLAEVHSKPQSDFLVNLAKTYGPGQSYWLGGRDDVIEGIWMWASADQVFNYTDWYPGEPSNSGGNENCLVYGAVALKWNDTPCRNAYRFICEKEYPGDGSEVIG
ncbi:galactose-specific lectin nattectin-like [Mytilus edulis]|uniref:galactose-specific lectin nattectin-like n=1 Tax=Mytilus edulis TaxID=6550 RepID=UPI0039F05F38